MGHSWVSELGFATFTFALIFALAKGSSSERLGVLWVLAVDLISDAVMAVTFPHAPQLVLFGLDFLLAAGLLALAVRFVSLWMGMAMLLQSIALCAHAYVLDGEGPPPIQWMILNNIISELLLACIIVATAASWRSRSSKIKTRPYQASTDEYKSLPASA